LLKKSKNCKHAKKIFDKYGGIVRAKQLQEEMSLESILNEFGDGTV